MNVATTLKPYLSGRSWATGLARSWLHVACGALLTWIASNGVEASAQQCPVRSVAYAFAGVGLTWKQGLIQAAVHASVRVIRSIYEDTATRHPFHKRKGRR